MSKQRQKFLISFYKKPYTHFYRIIEEGGSQRPPPHRLSENWWRNIDILYIILKGILWRFRFILNFWKYFDFAILSAIFAKWLRNGSRMAVRKKFRLLKYEHIIYSFEARNLEILNM